jgi:HemY protein
LLIKASHANPDPDWRCGACGAETDRWVVSCPSCHSFGSVEWRAPLRVHQDEATKETAKPDTAKPSAIAQTGVVIDQDTETDKAKVGPTNDDTKDGKATVKA